MKSIQLTKPELKACWDQATLLNDNHKFGYPSKAKHFNAYVGNVGEMAYSKYTGLPVNFTLTPRGQGDGGEDFPGVQVKTNTWMGDNKQIKVSLKDKSLTNRKVKSYVLVCFNKIGRAHV